MREEKQNLVRLRNKTANSFLLFGDILLPCKEILLGPHHVAPLDPCQNAKGDWKETRSQKWKKRKITVALLFFRSSIFLPPPPPASRATQKGCTSSRLAPLLFSLSWFFSMRLKACSVWRFPSKASRVTRIWPSFRTSAKDTTLLVSTWFKIIVAAYCNNNHS